MNKYVLIFFICIGLVCINSIQAFAQIDSTTRSYKAYKRILGKGTLSKGEIRGFILGDSIAVILQSEKAILEAQGDDFLYYRVLCDSIVSAELSYTFDEKGLLISIGIEFFEANMCNKEKSLSDEFLVQLNRYSVSCIEKETGLLECTSEKGMQIEFQKQQDEMCLIHTQIEFY